MNKNLIAMLLMLFFIAPLCAQEDKTSGDKENKRPSWSKGLPERQKATDLKTNEFKPEIDTDLEIDRSEFGLIEKPKIEIELPISANIGLKKIDSETQEDDHAIEDVAIEEPEPVRITPPVVDTTPETSNIVDNNLQQENTVPVESIPEPITEVQETKYVETQQIEITDEDVSEEPVIENNVVQDSQVQENIVEPVTETNENPVDESTTQEGNNESISDDVNSEPNTNIATQANEKEFVWEITNRTPVDYPPRAAVENIEGWVNVEVTINPDGEVISASPVKYSRGGRVFGKNAIKSVKNWSFKAPKSEGINTNLSRIYKIEFDL